MSAFFPWKILHIELSRGISPLPPEEGIGGIYLVFWWHGIPLGHQEIPANRLPMPLSSVRELVLKTISIPVGDHLFDKGFQASLPVVSKKHPKAEPPDFENLIALARPLEELHIRYALPSNSTHSAPVSIVICTRNRPEQLDACLRSIQELTQPPQEIIVVDNNPSSEATRLLVRKTPNVNYVLEPRPGLSAARNAGIRHARAEIIAFTDDDVTVHPDWIARLQQGFENPKVMAVTGPVLPAELETEAQFIFQHIHGRSGWGFRKLLFNDKFFEQMKNRGVPVWQIGAGANMAFRRIGFELIGGFDERLGAGACGCSEDSEMWYRVLSKNWFCFYEPTAVVFHHHRREIIDLHRQMFQYMRGHMAALLIQFEKHRHWGNLYRAFVTLPHYYARLFLKHASKGFKPRESSLGAQVLGCLAGVTFYLKHRSGAKK